MIILPYNRKHNTLLKDNSHELLRVLSEDEKNEIIRIKDNGRGVNAHPGEVYWKNWKAISKAILNDALPAWNKVIGGSVSGTKFVILCC